MSMNSVARATRFIFRPSSAASTGGVSGLIALAHWSPNAALVISAGGVSGWTALVHRSPNAALAVAYRRHILEFVPTRRAFVVYILALVQRMEARAIQSKRTEAILSAITEVLNGSLENAVESFVSRGRWRRNIISLYCNSRLKNFEAILIYSTGGYESRFQKLLTGVSYVFRRIRKQISETTDRTAKQIEETTDRISKQVAEFTDRITKLDREVNALRAQLPVEIHGLRAQIEAAKYDVIKYCIGTVVSISAVTLAVLRIGL